VRWLWSSAPFASCLFSKRNTSDSLDSFDPLCPVVMRRRWFSAPFTSCQREIRPIPLTHFRKCHQETLFVGFVCSYVLVSRPAFPFITAFDSCTQVIRMPRTVTITNDDKSSIFSIRSRWTNESRSTERCYNTHFCSDTYLTWTLNLVNLKQWTNTLFYNKTLSLKTHQYLIKIFLQLTIR
jgi:hypothetical protein